MTVPRANPYAACPVADPAERAALYDNNASPRNQADLRALQAASAQAYERRAGALREHRWGPAPWQWIDVFAPQGTQPRAALVFVHGGRWERNTSRETSFWAEACCDAGALFLGLNFPPQSQAGMDGQVDAVAASVRAALDHVGALGLPPAQACLAGHSSGAHLALAALLAQPVPVGSLLLLGGMYDLRPMGMEAAHSPLLRLQEAAERGQCLALPPTLVAVGDQESPEFVRQARALHWALQAHATAGLHAVPGAAHFDAALEFNRPHSVLRLHALGHGH